MLLPPHTWLDAKVKRTDRPMMELLYEKQMTDIKLNKVQEALVPGSGVDINLTQLCKPALLSLAALVPVPLCAEIGAGGWAPE